MSNTLKNSSNLIPEMTSNNSPSGEAFASNEYSAERGAWKAFTKNVDSIKELWLASANSSYPRYLGYKFPTPTLVNRYRITARKDTTNDRRNPKAWKFQGSRDGKNYVTLHKYKKMHWEKGEVVNLSFQNTQPFQYYRLLITENIGAGGTSVQRLEMFLDERPRYFLKGLKEGQWFYIFIDGDNNIELTQEYTEIALPIDFRKVYYYKGKRISLSKFFELAGIDKIQLELETQSQEEEPYIQLTQDTSIRHDFLGSDSPEILVYNHDMKTNHFQVLGERPEEFVTIEQPFSTSVVDRLVFEDNSEGNRYLFSPNQKDWYRYSKTKQQWEQVQWEQIAELNKKAMCKFETMEISQSEWQELGQTIYVGILFPSQENQVKSILVEQFNENKTPEINGMALQGENSLPSVNAYVDGQYLIGEITDNDSNAQIGYRVLVGEDRQVLKDELHNLTPAPREIGIRIPDKYVPSSGTNPVYIEFQDEWGTVQTEESAIYNLKQQQGIIVYDSVGDILVDGAGKVLKSLQFGELENNKISRPIKIVIANKTPFELKDIVALVDNYDPNDLDIYMSFSEDGLLHAQQGVVIPKLKIDEKIELFLRLRPKTEKTKEQSLNIELYANDYIVI